MTHFNSDMRELFNELVSELFKEPLKKPLQGVEPVIELNGNQVTLGEFCQLFLDCSDTMPSEICGVIGTQKGSSYSQGATEVSAYLFHNFRKLPVEIAEIMVKKHSPINGTPLYYGAAVPFYSF